MTSDVTAEPFKRPRAPAWAQRLIAGELAPLAPDGSGGVWTIKGAMTSAVISDQFAGRAGTYHQRYGHSDHFLGLFERAFKATGVEVRAAPTILDLGSGSGVNSVLPCLSLFPDAQVIATDLSAELLGMLAGCVAAMGPPPAVVAIAMDAMGDHAAHGAFDLVTGASILHHLEKPELGINAAARALRSGGHAVFFEPFDGNALMRLAYQRILAEVDRHGADLDPAVVSALRAMVLDLAARADPDTASEAWRLMDDKWLFSREWVEEAAMAAGFSRVQFVPHSDRPMLYRRRANIQIRLATGREDLTLPAWAEDIMGEFDDAIPAAIKRLLMVEASIVLTK